MSDLKRLRIASPLRLSELDLNIKAPMNWLKCCICQTDGNSPLSNPQANPVLHKRQESYQNLATNLEKCRESNILPMQVDIRSLDDGSGIAATLEKNRAKWHDNCKRQFCSSKIKKRQSSQNDKENVDVDFSRQTRLSTPLVKSEDGVCIFACNIRTGKLHSLKDPSVLEKMKNSAILLGDSAMIAQLSPGNPNVWKSKYHLNCQQKFFKRSVAKVKTSDPTELEVCERLAFADLRLFIREKLNDEESDFLLMSTDLMQMYKERLVDILGVPLTEAPYIHASRFREKIHDCFPQIEASKCGKGYVLRDERADISASADREDADLEAMALLRGLKAVHRLLGKSSTRFTGATDDQVRSYYSFTIKTSYPPRN